MNYLSVIYDIIVIALIVLFVISFTLFIRRILLNQARRNQNLMEENVRLQKIEEKLDRIIVNQEKHS